MTLAIALLWILSVTGLFVLIFNKRFGLMAPLSLIAGALYLYLFSFVNQLKLGYYLNYIFVIGFFIALVFLLFGNRTKFKDFVKNYVTIDFFIFTALIVYFYFLQRLRGFYFCDEFTHWGQMVKETIKYNGFYSQSINEYLRHKDYPPFFTLVETLWCMFEGRFSESLCFIGLDVFTASLFMPLFSKFNIRNGKDWIKGLAVLAGSLLLLLCISRTDTASDYAHVLNSIYVDWCMAIFTAYSFYTVLSNKDYSWLEIGNIAFCGVVLLLMKQMGLPFFMLVCLLYVLKLTFIDNGLTKKNILKTLVIVIVPFVFYFSWKYVINYYDVASSGQFSVGQIKLFDTIDILKGRMGNEWQRDAYRSFVSAIISRPLITNPINISYFPAVIIFSLIIALTYRNRTSVITSLVYAFGSCAYAGAMLLLYMYSFSSEEAMYIASFDRYMMTYIYIGMVIAYILVVSKIIESNKYTLLKLAVVVAICFTFTEKEELSDYLPKTSVNNENSINVLVLHHDYDYFDYYREDLNGLKFNFTIIKYEDLNMDEDSLNNLLAEYRVIYNMSFDQNFYDNYWSKYFDAPYYSDTTYQIIKGETLEIEYIEFQYLARVLRYYINYD